MSIEKTMKWYENKWIVGILIFGVISIILGFRNSNNTPSIVPVTDNKVINEAKTAEKEKSVSINSNELQEKCSRQSERVLEAEIKRTESTTLMQTNHYNKELGKCFVRMTDFQVLDSEQKYVALDSIVDAYQGNPLISCYTMATVDKTCFIPGNSSSTGEAVYLTKDEFEKQIRDYMNN